VHALAIPVALAIRPATPTAAPSTTSRSARPSSARCTGRPQGTLLATGDRGPECSAGRGSSWPPGRIASNSPTPDFVASPAGPAPALIGGTECPRPPADPSPRRRTSRPCATTPRAPVPRGSRKELRTPADDRLSPYLAGPAADIRVGQALRVLLTATVLGRVRVLPVPDRRDRDGPRGATQAGQRHPPAAAVLGTARGYPMPATPGET